MEEKQKMMIFFLLVTATVPNPVLAEEWKANVVKSLSALLTSCVVVPCSFTYPEKLPTSRLRGIWHRPGGKEECIYHTDITKVLDNFKGRTKLVGDLGEGNCTLEITQIRDHDTGPFCFRIELTQTEGIAGEKFSFVEDCVSLEMLSDLTPTVYHQKTAVQDRPFSVICRVTHACPTHPPALTWSRGTADEVTSIRREVYLGTWEEESILTFLPGEKDDQTEITCTAEFYGHTSSSAKMTLYVTRIENYNHIIIPAAVGIGTIAIFTVFCVLIINKYKGRIAVLQQQEGSVWNRMSKLSRRIRR